MLVGAFAAIVQEIKLNCNLEMVLRVGCPELPLPQGGRHAVCEHRMCAEGLYVADPPFRTHRDVGHCSSHDAIVFRDSRIGWRDESDHGRCVAIARRTDAMSNINKTVRIVVPLHRVQAPSLVLNYSVLNILIGIVVEKLAISPIALKREF